MIRQVLNFDFNELRSFVLEANSPAMAQMLLAKLQRAVVKEKHVDESLVRDRIDQVLLDAIKN